jgi:hypothetical protein
MNDNIDPVFEEMDKQSALSRAAANLLQELRIIANQIPRATARRTG